jgi:hypothetical protein
MNGLEIITAIVAIYGAVLSTIIAINELRKNRPKVKVSASIGRLYSSDGQPSEPVILIEAINIGTGVVALNGVGWLGKDGFKQHIIAPYPPRVLPVDLQERKLCTTAFACRWFCENIENSKVEAVYFQDQTGRKWISKIDEKQRELWLSAKNDGWKLA